MIVSIVRGGGIAGVAVRTRLATDALPAADERRLEQLAAAVAPGADRAARHPDETLYRVTVDDTVAIYTESTLPEEVRALIDFVLACPEREEDLDRG